MIELYLSVSNNLWLIGHEFRRVIRGCVTSPKDRDRKGIGKKPLRFADLKRKLKISSSGLLDFHLKKLDDLVAVNGEGCYYLNESGYAALTVIESVSGYHKLRLARRRSFYLNLITCVLVNIGAIWTASQLNNYALWYAIILPITVA